MCGLSPAVDGSVHFSAVLALAYRLTFVCVGLAAGHGDFDLGDAAFVEIRPDRNKGEPFLLDLGFELAYLPRPSEQLASAIGLVPLDGLIEGIRGDVHPDEPELIVFDGRIGLFERRLALAEALDLAAAEDDPALDTLEQLEAKARFAIATDAGVVFFLLGHVKLHFYCNTGHLFHWGRYLADSICDPSVRNGH